MLPGSIIFGSPNNNLVWLANCSATHITDAGLAELPLPTTIVPDDPSAFACICAGERFRDALGLPRDISWRFSERRARDAAFDRGLNRELIADDERKRQGQGPPGEPGHVEAEYKVLRSTEISGVSLPEEFLLTRSARVSGPKEVVIRRMKGEQSITNSPDLSLLALPHWDKGYFVIDHRFRHETKLVDFIQYVTNTPTTTSQLGPDLQAAYAQKVAAAPEDPAK